MQPAATKASSLPTSTTRTQPKPAQAQDYEQARSPRWMRQDQWAQFPKPVEHHNIYHNVNHHNIAGPQKVRGQPRRQSTFNSQKTTEKHLHDLPGNKKSGGN